MGFLVIGCGALEPVTNGLPAVGNSTTVNSIKTFRCEECFKLLGSKALVCQDTGLWNDSLPTCDRESLQCDCLVVVG